MKPLATDMESGSKPDVRSSASIVSDSSWKKKDDLEGDYSFIDDEFPKASEEEDGS